MNKGIFSEYRFKFYLNASHSIVINGKQGEVHPHTWEIALTILVERNEFMEFNVYEKAAEKFISQYQDQTMNDVKPFDTIVPTLENIVDYFGAELREVMHDVGGELMRIEGSETPTRSYAVSYMRDDEYLGDVKGKTDVALEQMIDEMLKNMLYRKEKQDE